MQLAEGFIGVDWGTTNRRAYLIDGGGTCSGEFEDGLGVLSVPSGGFPAAIREIRDRLGNWPLVLAGMVGSSRGWLEIPYVACPAGLDELAGGVVPVDGERAILVPGLSYRGDARADVMRGEEVQVLGALANRSIPGDCLICHPGTHNKWVRVEEQRIETFRTVMTGELFNLLREHSILSDLLDHPVSANEPFRAGVRHGLEHNDTTAELFSVRARVLLGDSASRDAACYTSGLLIGSDVKIGLGGASDAQVVVMGRPELTALYAAALDEAGRTSQQVDGERSFVAGITRLAEMIE